MNVYYDEVLQLQVVDFPYISSFTYVSKVYFVSNTQIKAMDTLETQEREELKKQTNK